MGWVCFNQSASLEKRVLKEIPSALNCERLFVLLILWQLCIVHIDPIHLPPHLLQYPPQSNLCPSKQCCPYILNIWLSTVPWSNYQGPPSLMKRDSPSSSSYHLLPESIIHQVFSARGGTFIPTSQVLMGFGFVLYCTRLVHAGTILWLYLCMHGYNKKSLGVGLTLHPFNGVTVLGFPLGFTIYLVISSWSP